VVRGSGTGYPDYYPVTEIHVDKNGDPLPGVSDNQVLMAYDSIYSNPVTPLPGYDIIGYKWDTKPDGSGTGVITSGNPSRKIQKAETIYFVYGEEATKTDVTVSKQVSGINPDKTKDFTFTAYFTDDKNIPLPAGVEFAYEGSAIAGSGATAPANGTLTLTSGGKAVFTLKHGQAITIKDVKHNSYIRVEETLDSNYEAAFIDNAGAPGANDTGLRQILTDSRRFDFNNKRIPPPPTGVNAGDPASMALLMSIVFLAFAGGAARIVIRRKITE
jgi:hypothetical protein